MKGLPLTYNRDMQLDKPPLFESVDKVKDILQLLSKLFESLEVEKANVKNRIKKDESFFSVDIMEYLIKKRISYREAHDIVGEIVKESLDWDRKISDISYRDLKSYSSAFEEDVKKLLNAEASVKNKKSLGSTNPIMVEKQLGKWKKILK